MVEHRIAIECECTPLHDWMGFVSWYSFKKTFPDFEVWIEVDLDKPLFRWAHVLNALGHRREADFRFSPSVVAVRDFDGRWEVCPTKSRDQGALVDYSGGCGKFVFDKWINNGRAPFQGAFRRFGTPDMTANEAAVLKLWEKCDDVYRAVGYQ